MANFIALVDGDSERRRRFVERVRDQIAPVDSLRTDSVESGDFAAVWAARHHGPVSSTSTVAAVAIVWGDAIPGPGPDRLEAPALIREWRPRGDAPPLPYDGFYAAIRYDQSLGITAGGDLLGFFPLYYAATAGTIVLGSSPELFRHHPLFPARLSHEGLVGLLLTHAVFEGRALLSGVRRLSPGHVLRWQRGSEPVELLQYRIPEPPRGAGGSFWADVDRLDSVLDEAIDRHMPRSEPTAMLLSGGRDSRQIAGYLRERGAKINALTMGDATDYEVMCATEVARVLGSSHRVTPFDDSKLPLAAELQAKWEQLGSGFSSVHMWGAVPPLRELPPRFICGYLRDIRELEPMPVAFDELVHGSKHRGIPAATLRRLLRANVFNGLIDSLEGKLRDVYVGGSIVESQRPSRFFLAHDWRAHAGGVPWKLSFGSWPVLPILDRALLETIFTLPDSSLVNRRAQDAILRRRFPDLARLPLDRNTHETVPLLPSPGQRLRHRFGRIIEPLRRRIPRKIERRYYHRMYDINNPGWRAVRELAEPHRDRLSDLFDMDVLGALVPSPDARIPVEHKVRDSFGTKQLIGLMLWSATHLS